MIFTQADRDRIAELTTALTSLRLDVGMRQQDESHHASLHQRFRDLTPLLNELGAALGRIESALRAHDHAQDIIDKKLEMIFLSSNPTALEQIKTINKSVNYRADTIDQRLGFHGETLDKFAVRLTKLEEFLQGNLGRALEQRKSEDERVRGAIQAFIMEANGEFGTKPPKRKARRKKK